MSPRLVHHITLLSFTVFVWAISSAQSSPWSAKEISQAQRKLGRNKDKLKNGRDRLLNSELKRQYSRECGLGIRLYSNGIGGNFHYSFRKDESTLGILQISFAEIKHDKQQKQLKENTAFPQFGVPAAFVYGKVNNAYALQISYGLSKLILPSMVNGNLSVSWRYSAGLGLGMLKPYYLKLLYADYAKPEPVYEMKDERYNEENADMFLKENNIFGGSKWSKGLGETKIVPGVNCETAIVIETDSKKALVKTITLGVNSAFYLNKLPIMADIKATRWHTSLFAGLTFGKRW